MTLLTIILLYIASVFLNRSIQIYLIRDDGFKMPFIWFIPLYGTLVMIIMLCIKTYNAKERNTFKNFVNWFIDEKE